MTEMAKYMLLIYGDQQSWAEADAAEMRRIDEGHTRFRALAGTAVLGGRELGEATTATSVRANRNGAGPAVTDGPFLETKEVLGGYYVVEADDLDAAIRLAAELPEAAADYSGVEIRPVVES
jgi:hypothetical protein